jgi:hypothetical protein
MERTNHRSPTSLLVGLKIGHFDGFRPSGRRAIFIEVQLDGPLPSARRAMPAWEVAADKEIALLAEGVSTSKRTYKHSTPSRVHPPTPLVGHSLK